MQPIHDGREPVGTVSMNHRDRVRVRNTRRKARTRRNITSFLALLLTISLVSPSHAAALTNTNALYKTAGQHVSMRFIQYPEIQRNSHDKQSRVYEYRQRSSWNGSHTYTCGVSGLWSTHAEYNFGEIPRSGTYGVFAYYPGHNESYDHRNNGSSYITAFVDGEIRNYRHEDQAGGWQPLLVGPKRRFLWWDHGNYSKEVYLTTGSRFSINIDNGAQMGDPSPRSCGTGGRTVFPPLLLVRLDDVRDYRPFDPLRDINPVALSLFAQCVLAPAEYDLSNLIEDLNAWLENFTIAGPATAAKNLRDWQAFTGRLSACDAAQYEPIWCRTIPKTGHWTEPASRLNSSVAPSRERLFERKRAGLDYWFGGSEWRLEAGPSCNNSIPRPSLDSGPYGVLWQEGILWIRRYWG